MKRLEDFNGLSLQVPISQEELLDREGLYTSVIRDCIDKAISEEASDIHFEPTSLGLLVKARIAGKLTIIKKIDSERSCGISPLAFKTGLFNELKRVSNCSLGVYGKRQDRKIIFPERKISVRVSLGPTTHGEKVVYRLQDLSKKFELEKSGLPEKTVSLMREMISKENGIIILSGETGSGKTTTVYSLLNEIDAVEKSIATLEDPVEREFPYINHIEINSQFGFADGLKTLMRQDPDVIFVGEIRDSESARLAFEAASTGHLVITTLHAPSAEDVIVRLKTLGIDDFQINTSLKLVSNQSLHRFLCPKCSTEVESDGKYSALLDGNISHAKRKNDQGCANCFKGDLNKRVLLLEYIRIERLAGASKTEKSPTRYEQAKTMIQKGELDVSLLVSLS